MRISFFNLHGFIANDPLDKAPVFIRFVLLGTVNLVLTIFLIYLITNNAIISFNGFELGGFKFPPFATMVLEVFMNGIVYSSLIVLLRKASSVYHFLIVFIPYFLLDLFIEHHFRQTGHPELALWNYFPNTPITHINPPVLRFLVSLSADAILFGITGVYLARLCASFLYRHRLYTPQPTEKQFNEVFKREWSDENVQKPKRGMAFWVLRLLGLGYLVYLSLLLLGLLGSGSWPKGIANLLILTYRNPALAINTYFKIGLMIMLSFLAAYNKKLRFHACLGLLVGHIISTVYSFIFSLVESLHASDRDFLTLSGYVDGVMIVIFAIIMFTNRAESKEFAPEKDLPVYFSAPLSLQDLLYKILSGVFLAITFAIVLFRVLGEGKHGFSAIYGYPDPMVGNTVTLYGTLTLYYFLLISRRKLRQYFFNPLVVPLLFGSMVALMWVLIGDLVGDVIIMTRWNAYITAYWYFILFAIFNLLISILLIATRKAVFQIDYAINTIQPSGAVCTMAFARALLNANEKQAADTLKEIDNFAGGIRGRKRGLLNLPFGLFENVLSLIYGFRPPFSSMSKEEQIFFTRKYFFRTEIERRKSMMPYLSSFAFNIGLSINSLVSFAYYSTLNARAEIGYVPVDARDRIEGDIALYPPPHIGLAPLPRDQNDPHNFIIPTRQKVVAPRVTTPVKEPEIPAEVDYLIIGSGAAGATMAYRLACEVLQPDKIMVVERGYRYQPLQDFTDKEIEMIKKIYKEGGLQQTKRFTMTVLQGECVGGTTVTNNAVCFKMPSVIRNIWENEFDLHFDQLDEEYQKIAEELSIQQLKKEGINQKVKACFEKGVSGYNNAMSPEERLMVDGIVQVNHLNTVGDGNWNLGNKRMLKRSMLETYLPWAEARGANIVSNTTAVRFNTDANSKRVTSVLLRADNGALTRVNVKKAVIVAGGVISSSHFLLRSDVKGAVGEGMSCNFAFPFTFDFEEKMQAYDGDQITMAASDPQNRAVFETYFNPPASFSLASVPFFFRRRLELMSRYDHLVNFGTLIGAEPNGKINAKADILYGQAFDWEFGEKDLQNIKYAFKTLLLLGMYAGGRRAFLPTKPGIEIPLTINAINSFTQSLNSYPLRMNDVYTGTAHPQGGNRMAGNNFTGDKVVDENFRVNGLENMYVTDASIFPTSLTVNPQWTIMALSSLASQIVIASHE